MTAPHPTPQDGRQHARNSGPHPTPQDTLLDACHVLAAVGEPDLCWRLWNIGSALEADARR